MPRRGENIYKRKDGRWEARYIKEYSINGKAKYGYVYAHSYKEVKTKLNKILSAECYKKLKNNLQDQYYSYWVQKWLYNKQTVVKASTHNQYKNIVNNHLLPFFGNLKLNEISTEKIEEFVSSLLSDGNRITSVGLSPKTVSDILAILKETFRYIKANNMDIQYSFATIKIKQPRKNMRVLSLQEEKKLIQHLIFNMDRFKFGILLSLYTGIRIGELCALQGKHFSFSEKTLLIEQTVQRLQTNDTTIKTKTELIITPPKSDCSVRVIPLPDFLYCYESYLKIPDNNFLLSGSQKIVEPRTMQNHFKRYLKESSIPDANYHALRHTFATRCVEAGFDIKSLSEILGHSSVKITLDKYVHASMQLKRKNMKKLSLPLVESLCFSSKQ